MAQVDVKADLAGVLESQASWRQQKAEEYEEDIRNEHAAAALARLQEFVLGLPYTNPLLVRLEQATEGDGELILFAGNQLSGHIGRIGFERYEIPWTDEQCYAEIETLVYAIEEWIDEWSAEQDDE